MTKPLKNKAFQRFTTPQLRTIASEQRAMAIRSALKILFSKNPSAKDTLEF